MDTTDAIIEVLCDGSYVALMKKELTVNQTAKDMDFIKIEETEYPQEEKDVERDQKSPEVVKIAQEGQKGQ